MAKQKATTPSDDLDWPETSFSEPDVPWDERVCPSTPHMHRTPQGFLVRCYHQSRGLVTDWKFWGSFLIGTMVSFPIEHYLYEKVWPFKLLTAWLGL